jgi:hypothetical protein
MSWTDAMTAALTELHTFQERRYPEFITRAELASHLGTLDAGVEPQLMQARVQKSLLALSKQKLVEDLSLADLFKKETGWKWLNQLLAATRLKQLTLVKIVRKSRKGKMGFDLSELQKTYYGKQILAGLQLGTRKVVDKTEFETVKAACAAIKLTLPETIEPTRTERFFVDADAAADDDDAEASADTTVSTTDTSGVP